jgi:uncharacterized damage-inducible protein DinB
MDIQDAKLIFDYNYWANNKLLTASLAVSPEQFVALSDFPHGSLRGTLLHTLDAEYGWRVLCEKGIETQDLKETEYPTVSSLVVHWHTEEAAMRGYLKNLKNEDLTGIIRYTTNSGLNRERVLWHCLYHVVNHGTQHRSEAAAILTGFYHSPGDFDFSMFMLEKKKQ